MNARPAIFTAALAIFLSGLSTAPADAASRSIITGTVTDAAGHAIKGAVVEYHALGGGNETSTTSSSGAYRLRTEAATHAYLDVYDHSPLPAWTSGDFTLEPNVNFTRDVVLTGAVVPTVLYGRVTDASTGKPIRGLHISSLIHEEDNDSDAYTDRNGWFAFTEFDGEGEGYARLSGRFTYDLFTEATSKYKATDYDEEDPTGAGPGIVVGDGQQVRFDFSVSRLRASH